MSLLIDRFPRLDLAALPTPLQDCPRLSARLGGPRIMVKRDDLTGRAGGGNKIRKLEYVLADHGDADCLVSIGVNQSNSVRQIAGVGAALGLEVHIAWITDRVPNRSADYKSGGNALLTNLFGATLHPCSYSDDRGRVLEAITADLVANGKNPVVLPYGISSALGALGYVMAADELQHQLKEQHIVPSAVIHASGTGGTQAGLTVGLHHSEPLIQVIGVDVDAEPERVRRDVSRLVAETSSVLGVTTPDESIEVYAGCSGSHYGSSPDPVLEALGVFATTEGMVLDPVYSGVGAAGLIAMVAEGRFSPDDTVVFIHTGGGPGLHAYRETIVPRFDTTTH